MAFGALLLIGLWTVVLGRCLLGLLGGRDSLSRAPGLAVVAGLVGIHLLLKVLTWIGIEWTRSSLLLTGMVSTILCFAAAARWGSAGEPRVERELGQPPWLGRGVAGLAVAAFALACYSLRSPLSDFVYHWGAKARRFFEVGGVDIDYLARPEAGYMHPDYPNLVPELFAAVSVLAGHFHEPTLMLISALFLALILLLLDRALEQASCDPQVADLGLAAAALGLSAFSIGYYQGGSADLPMALAVLLGGVALQQIPAHRSAPAVGLAAAFAAAVKIEGLVLAAALLSLWWLRARWSAEMRQRLKRRFFAWAMQTIVPLSLVVVPWGVQVVRRQLFQSDNAGRPELGRLFDLLPALWDRTWVSAWQGLPLLLLLLPILLARRPTRMIGALLAVQAVFYLFTYANTPVDAEFLVLTTWPRLALHLMPLLLVGLLLTLPSERRRAAR